MSDDTLLLLLLGVIALAYTVVWCLPDGYRSADPPNNKWEI